MLNTTYATFARLTTLTASGSVHDPGVQPVNSSGGAVTVTLRTRLAKNGDTVIVMDAGAAAATNNITVACQGSEQINGANTKVISTNRNALLLIGNGSKTAPAWHAFTLAAA